MEFGQELQSFIDRNQNILEGFLDENLEQIVFSNPRDREKLSKVKIRPIKVKNSLMFQETRYVGAQVFHKNKKKEEVLKLLYQLLATSFKQCEIKHALALAVILVSKKGKPGWKVKRLQGREAGDPMASSLEHNRKKQYILPQEEPVDFLVELGVQAPDGKIHQKYYDKFKQINRYLEFIRDIADDLEQAQETLRIVDFGCGKSYLTFAMYYYLKRMLGRQVEIIGLDLKQDVITHCNEIAKKLGYEGLTFLCGDIKDYEEARQVDMVVTLHACDTATDYAIAQAISWGAKVIMVVPCCQHELNKKLQCKALEPATRYGLLKERMSALLTDAMRANLLEEQGYDTQILEFIDMEHTPKNLLIRGVRRSKMKAGHIRAYADELANFLGTELTLNQLLKESTD